MNKLFNFKRNDIIILAVVLVLAAASLLFYRVNHQGQGYGVRISVNSQPVAVYPLSTDQEVDISGYTGGHCTMTIKDGSASMSFADCPDQICVKHRPVNRNGESIICLPNRVVLEVVAEGGSDSDPDSTTDTSEDLDFILR